jgi:ribosomal protein S18 acetylase RimI-like enzyme
MIIRPFRHSDRAAMTALYSAAWHATYDAIDGPETIDRVIAALMQGEAPEMFTMPDGDIALVAESDGQLIGGIRGHPRGDAVHLSGMYVDPGTQRHGVGGALLSALLAHYPTGTAIRADVRPTSQSARTFYARNGFVEIGLGRTDVGGNHHVDMIELQRPATAQPTSRVALPISPTKKRESRAASLALMVQSTLQKLRRAFLRRA